MEATDKSTLPLEFINSAFFYHTVRKIFRNHFKIPVDVVVYDSMNYPNSEAKIWCRDGIPYQLMKEIIKVDMQAMPTYQLAQMPVNDWIEVFKNYL